MLKIGAMAVWVSLAAPMRQVTAMKSVVCRAVEEGKGKSGQELAESIEKLAVQFTRANYQLAAILPGDPPIACFQAKGDGNKLPPGAK